jgi:hypothetical protein
MTAFVLAVVLVAGMAVTAFASPVTAPATGGITGSVTIESPTLSVTLPNVLDFAIDQFIVHDDSVIEDSQISAGDFKIINNAPSAGATPLPVKVTYDIVVTLSGGATLADRGDIEQLNFDPEGKQIFLAVVGAKTLVASAGDIEDIVYDAEKGSETLVAFAEGTTANTATASITFALDAFDTDLAKENVAAFTLFGELDTYAAWANTNLAIAGVYTLNAMLASHYEDIEKGLVGNQQIPAGIPVGFLEAPGITRTSATAISVDRSHANFSSGSIVIPFNFEGVDVTKVTVLNQAGNLLTNPAITLEQNWRLYTPPSESTPVNVNFPVTRANTIRTTLAAGTTYTIDIDGVKYVITWN